MQQVMFIILFIVLVAGCSIGLYRWWNGRQKPINSELSSQAKIADHDEVKTLPEKVKSIPEGSILLGRVIGSDRKVGGRIASEEETSALVVGPTGSGKTSKVLIPAILRHKGPLLSTTTKDELARLTMKARKSLDPLTVVLDPAGVSNNEELDNSRKIWTPLQATRNFDSAIEIADIIMKTGNTGGGAGKENSPWQSAATSLLSILMWVCAQFPGTSMNDLIKLIGTLRSKKNTDIDLEEDDFKPTCVGFSDFSGLLDWCNDHDESGWQGLVDWLEWAIKNPGDSRPSFVKSIVHVDVEEADTVLGKLTVSRSVAEAAAETAAGVIFTLDASLREICTSRSVASTAWDDRKNLIDLDRWARSTAGSVYVVAPDSADPYRSLFSAFLATAVRALDAVAVASHDEKLPRQALLVLDELPSICPVPQLKNWLATKRSQNIRFVLGAQNLSQIEALWGKETAASIVDCCVSFQLLLRGSTDHRTTEHFAKYAGEYLHIIPQQSVAKSKSTTKPRGAKGDRSDTDGKTVTESQQAMFRPLAQDYALRELAKDEAVALILGNRFARLRMTPWYEDPELRLLVKHGHTKFELVGSKQLATKSTDTVDPVWNFEEVTS